MKDEPRVLRKIKYESELFPAFGKEIASMPGCENLYSCIQCGTCSGICPLTLYMDYTPRRIIAMTRAGFKEEVLRSSMIWLCASCYGCTVECPKEIKITDVMYALKQRAIQESVYPRRFAIPVLAKSFFKSVWKYGRNNEGRLILYMYLKSNPLNLIKQSFLGFKLWLKGRIGLRSESIRDRKSLQPLLMAVKEIQKGKTM